MQDKYEPLLIEDKWYSFWMQKGYFTADNTSKKPPFSIVIPPPNVTGSLHMGHALNNTLQDILCRYKRATGFNVLWVPGCDHAGIATQNVVERELKKQGIKRTDLGREEFLKRVWEWKEQYGKTIMMQLRKLGASCDWSRERFTMDEGLSDAVREVFVRLYKEGLIYRGDYIINWCPRCLTAISDIEVNHKESDGHLWHLRYPFKDGSGFVEVATTRPETMLGDTAVAVNPEDERYKKIIGKIVVLPIVNREIPVIADAFVDKTFGTGVVKITPAHDPNDFEACLRHKLPVIKVMAENGTMNENAGIYKGLDRFKCRAALLVEFEASGVLVKTETHKHAVGHCYRCDTVVEPYVSTQWFVKIKPLAEPAIKAVENDEIKFVPDMWKKVYFEWMRNIKDWCISRQLWWGHRIPAWYCDCGHMTISKTTPKTCEKCGSSEIRQDNDVLDTWFSSGLWPFSTLGWPGKTKDLEVYYPTAVLVTSWDILFFWIARMAMLGIKFMGRAPFAEVVINSLVTDSEGKKMSKSKGNVVDPLEIMKNTSADSLRFTMTSLETQSRHIAFSEDRAKGYHNFMNKIWNASKYTMTNIEGRISMDLTKAELKLAEKWILNELNILIKRVTEDMDKYRFADMALAMYEFFWHTFCDWYVEISKIELTKENNPYKNTVKNVLHYVLLKTTILMHPVIPFITEEVYQNLQGDKEESIMLAQWPKFEKAFETETAAMPQLQEIIYHIRNMRGELSVGPGEKIAVYIKALEGKTDTMIKENAEIIMTLAKAKEIHGEKSEKPTVVGRDIDKIGYIAIDIQGVVDVDKEVTRLKTKITTIENGIKTVEAKLANPGFAAKAPKKVLDEEQAKVEKWKEEIIAVHAAMDLLSKAK